MTSKKEWSGWVYPNGKDDTWVDDVTEELVDAKTGQRRSSTLAEKKVIDDWLKVVRP